MPMPLKINRTKNWFMILCLFLSSLVLALLAALHANYASSLEPEAMAGKRRRVNW
jgi:hypothetical protein